MDADTAIISSVEESDTLCIKVFSSLPCSLTILKNARAKFKVALRKYLNIHFLYSVYKFFMCTMVYNTVL
jgi:hypothetical protein